MDFQADSCICVQNGGAFLMPLRYLHLDFPKQVVESDVWAPPCSVWIPLEQCAHTPAKTHMSCQISVIAKSVSLSICG